MFERQKQEAGDNALQVQAGTIIIGIDEKRAREIIDEKLHEVINGYSKEAHAIAENRIQLFANDLVPKLVKANLLDELKDPSIQILLSDAQKTAASTERVVDYSLLSELLMHRVRKGNNRNIRAGVSRAIEIIDEISDEALLGLTAAHAVSHFIPLTGNIEDGIKVLANLFERTIYADLPSGNEWAEHLDILDAIRINNFGNLKKINQYYPEILSGYIAVGIEKNSESYQQAIAMINGAGLPVDILCDHELRSGYARLRILNINRLDLVSIFAHQTLNLNGQLVSLPTKWQLSEEQKKVVNDIYALYKDDPQLQNENIEAFIKLWDKYDCLKKLREWWDSIPQSFNITAVGRVLAHANAQRCDPTLPALD